MTKIGKCSAKCGDGKQILEFCRYTPVALDCSNVHKKSFDCNLGDCKSIEKYKFGEWSNWLDCDKPCHRSWHQRSMQKRTRECDPPDCLPELKIGKKQE